MRVDGVGNKRQFDRDGILLNELRGQRIINGEMGLGWRVVVG